MKRRDFLNWSAATAAAAVAIPAARADVPPAPAGSSAADPAGEGPATEETADGNSGAESSAAQAVLEWRTYQVQDAAKRDFVSAYLQRAALPAWQRLGVGPVGVFLEVGQEPDPALHVLLSYPDAEAFVAARQAMERDEKYRADAADYLAASKDDPAFVRIASELLLAFAGAPQVIPPQQRPRLYELRTYESHSESKARRKIDMFNDGEIEIFGKCGFEPVFFGETLIGPRLPNLKYMLASPDLDANQASWKRFVEHPDWLQIRDLPKYADTVSQIDKRFLTPTEYSQL
ncbi:MAG: NIPSNAP family containing protein [Planctomycetaceae bacterium]|nr:NIPSNAP family containing protein [Planctomycetaceae bacterium]